MQKQPLKKRDYNKKKKKTATDQQLKLLELLNEHTVESALINENRDGPYG